MSESLNTEYGYKDNETNDYYLGQQSKNATINLLSNTLREFIHKIINVILFISIK